MKLMMRQTPKPENPYGARDLSVGLAGFEPATS